MQSYITEQLQQLSRAAADLCSLAPQIERAAHVCLDALRSGHKIIFCGNGGSAAQSQHLAAELVGRYRLNRPALPALSLTVDTSNLTAIANDYSFDQVFARQLAGVGAAGDVLIGLSTSGNSRNVVLAMQQAQIMDIRRIALVGAKGGDMQSLAELVLPVPAVSSAHIQELHIAAGHLICDLIESSLYA